MRLFVFAILVGSGVSWGSPLVPTQIVTKMIPCGDDCYLSGHNSYRFSDGSSLDTDFFQLEYVTQFDSGNKAAPYLMFTGRSCIECDDIPAIYIFKRDPGKKMTVKTAMRFDYPGKLIHSSDSKLLQTVDVFYGECLKDFGRVAVWFTLAREHKDRWRRAVFVAKPGKKKMEVVTLDGHAMPDKTVAQKKLKSGTCKRIPGKTLRSAP